jgi:SPP1 gp7 family putative phage head morphogenesis protein
VAGTAWDITPDVHEFDEAVSWFQKRTVLTADDAFKLNERARSSAFWVGGGLQLQQVQDVFQALDKSIAKGETFEEFRARLKTNLKPAHASIVFRNATQRAYNAGRYEQMTQPDVLKFRPFWMYDSVLDSRTTTICKGYNQTVLPATDEWWVTRIPPNHHGCRASIRSLRRAEAERRGITTDPEQTQPAEGWSAHPLSPVGPPTGKDNRLVTELTRKTVKPVRLRKTKPKVAPVKGPPLEHTPEYWVAHYAPKYGDAAKSLGWGRAMQERGFDMTVQEIASQLPEAMKKKWETSKFLAHAPQGSTLREIGLVPEQVKLQAAYLQHAAAVKRLDKFLPEIVGATGADAEQLDLFRSVMSSVTDRRLVHANPVIEYEEYRKRAAYRPGSNRVLLPKEEPFYVIAHEWAHSIEEANQELYWRAVHFLKVRQGDEPYSLLNDLEFGGYRPDEKAFRDQLTRPYVGKFYDRSTEVTATGVEFLSQFTHEMAFMDEKTDLEHLFFTLGQLSGQ